jgi:hypothetical protein
MRRSARNSAAGMVALAAAGGLGGCMSTSTYGTGESPEVAMFREMTGGIPLVGRSKKEAIEHQPRAPLVLPPSAAQLPAPMETADASHPAWPQDEESAAPVPGEEVDPRAGGSQAEYRRLKPLGDAVGSGRGNSKYRDSDMQNAAYDIVNAKEERKAVQAAMDDAEGVGRTERRYLTEPPDAYREPAATAPTEFDGVKRKRGGLTKWLLGG